MSMQTYHGGCHCGAVRYAVDLDLSKGTLRCNCSLCRKSRAWFTFGPADAFRLEKGAESLSDYRWTPPNRPQPNLIYHFCSHCGVRTHVHGKDPSGADIVALQVATIEDVDRDQLAEGIRYVDGLHDHFDRAPPEDVRAL